MPETIDHQQLKSQAKEVLLSEGFSEEKILLDKKYFEEELNGIRLKFRADAYASNGSEVVIECGNFPKWKWPYYWKHFGKEHVRHFPYPLTYGRYLQIDVKEGCLDEGQAKQFMIDTYKECIYEEFKDDPVFKFIDFNEANRDCFMCDRHGKSTDYNPDFGEDDKAEHSTIWMNFPASSLQMRDDFMKEIHFGMLYYGKDIFGITIILSGKLACKNFLGLSQGHHDKIFSALKRLPSTFFIRSGYLDASSRNSPPYDKVWNNPIHFNELTKEDYDEVISDLSILTYEKLPDLGPALDLAKVFVHQKEVPEAIAAFRELYGLLITPETKTDSVIKEIKKKPSWQWCVQDKDDFEDLAKEFGIAESERRKIRSRLKKDPDFESWARENLR